MKYNVTVEIRSDADALHPPYAYKRTTSVRLSQFSRQTISDLIAEARADYEETYPHGQGRDSAMLVPATKVSVQAVD